MNINLNQFELLSYIEREGGKRISQRQLAQVLGISLGGTNGVIAELLQMGLIHIDEDRKMQITGHGMKALEPFRVKRVVILAAGFSERLMPISLNTPKPLIRVHGVPMIETLLEAIDQAGIRDVIIVRGYLKEQFEILKQKYSYIRFMENPFYNESNNISSAWIARKELQQAYIMEADLVIKNPRVIRKYEYTSNYLGVLKKETDDWCFEVKKGIINNVSVGGKNCYEMKGISFWNQQDGERLSEYINEAWHMPGGKERFWDEVALKIFLNKFNVAIRPCSEEDLQEIDTFKELKAIDPIYTLN